jgi:DnaK suppressor protein
MLRIVGEVASMGSSGEIRNAAGLTDAEIHVLRGRLERMRDELRARLAHEAAVSRQSEPLVEPVEAAEQTREQDDAILFAAHDRARLHEVEHALDKMSNGLYGLSEVSGEPISYERLLAVPWARHDSDEDTYAGAETP